MFTYWDPSTVAKTITEDILHNIYTGKGAITSIWLVLSTVEVSLHVSKWQTDTRKEVASYMGAT